MQDNSIKGEESPTDTTESAAPIETAPSNGLIELASRCEKDESIFARATAGRP
jgi:hypothetical protein